MSDSQINYLVSKIIGESSKEYLHVACVARNRLIAGWNPTKIHKIFYAKPQKYTETQKQEIISMIDVGEGCNPKSYFQWSDADITWIKPNPNTYLYSAGGNNYYTIDALKGK